MDNIIIFLFSLSRLLLEYLVGRAYTVNSSGHNNSRTRSNSHRNRHRPGAAWCQIEQKIENEPTKRRDIEKANKPVGHIYLYYICICIQYICYSIGYYNVPIDYKSFFCSIQTNHMEIWSLHTNLVIWSGAATQTTCYERVSHTHIMYNCIECEHVRFSLHKWIIPVDIFKHLNIYLFRDTFFFWLLVGLLLLLLSLSS